MKLLMTADTVGGVWTYSMELARALNRHGVSVVLATMGALPTAEQRAECRAVGNIELHASDWRLEWMDDPWEDVRRASDWLLNLEQRTRPDIVHLNSYAHSALPWGAPVLVVGHSCVLSWWDAVKGERAPSRWDRYRHEIRRGLRAAEFVIAPTQAMLTALEKHSGPFNAMEVVGNGRDSQRFVPLEKEHFIFSAGRIWDEAKNVGLLASVAGRLPWPVCIAGPVARPGERGHREHPEVQKSPAFLVGEVASSVLPGWYGRAAIYALPARYEPFGLSILEAGLAGCALVLGDIESLHEIWGDAALFVQPDDAEALERALRRLIADEALRKMMAERARERALEFTPERMAEGYLSVYRGLHAARTRRSNLESHAEAFG